MTKTVSDTRLLKRNFDNLFKNILKNTWKFKIIVKKLHLGDDYIWFLFYHYFDFFFYLAQFFETTQSGFQTLKRFNVWTVVLTSLSRGWLALSLMLERQLELTQKPVGLNPVAETHFITRLLICLKYIQLRNRSNIVSKLVRPYYRDRFVRLK